MVDGVLVELELICFCAKTLKDPFEGALKKQDSMCTSFDLTEATNDAMEAFC